MIDYQTADIREIAEHLNFLKRTAELESRSDEGVWEELYDYLFSDKVSRVIQERFDFNYYDPDATSKDDVCAFIRAFNVFAKGYDTLSLEIHRYR